MKRFVVIVIAALMMSGMTAAGARQNAVQAEKLLASAKHRATVDGDPKGAIEEYKRALAAAGSNRARPRKRSFAWRSAISNWVRWKRRRFTNG